MRYLLVLTALFFTVLSVLPAQAHRMNVFAYESDGQIIVEATFGSGRPAKHITVRIEDEGGSVLLTGTTDEQGISRLPLPAGAIQREIDLTIVADAGEGHLGTWLLAAEDYGLGGATVESTAAEGEEKMPQPGVGEDSSTPAADNECGNLNYKVIESIVKKTVAAELAPVKRQLAASHERNITLQDIFGGIGYILGLAGIAAYFQARRKGEK